MKKLLFLLLLPIWFVGLSQTSTELQNFAAAFAKDYAVTGAAAQTTLGNNIMLASAGSGSFDALAGGTVSYHSFSCQVNMSSGISSGAYIFEESNDNTNWIPITVFDKSTVGAAPIVTAQTATASTFKYFHGKISCQFVRCRISTAIVGGSIQAFTRYSVYDFIPPINSVTQASPGTLNGNVGQINGVAPLMGNGVTGTGSHRVTIASDNTANSNPWLVQDVTGTTNGSTTSTVNSAATTNATNLKATAGMIWSIQIMNASAATKYIRIYNKASAPTVGTDVPVMTIAVPATSSIQQNFGVGIKMSTGIAYAITNAAAVTDATPVAAGDVQLLINWQ